MNFKKVVAAGTRHCAACGKVIETGTLYFRSQRKNADGLYIRKCAACVGAGTTQHAATGSATIAAFDSPAAFVAGIKKSGTVGRSGSNAWHGADMATAQRMALSGDDSLVPQASALLDALRVEMPDTQRTAYIPAPCGTYPIVPEVLTGFPLSMRTARRVNDDRAAVRIVVDLTVSAGVDHGSIRKRGTVALALAMLVAEQRPLELLTVTALDRGAGKAGIVAVNIPARPLELATACHALTATSFFRQMGYAYLSEQMGCGGGWGWQLYPDSAHGRGRYCAEMRKALALTERDVLVPPVFLTDTIIRNPVQWINERMAEVNGNADA